MSILYFFLTLTLVKYFANGIYFKRFGNDFEFLAHELNKTIVTFDSSSSIKESWLEVPLDHFNSNDNRTWMMRYFERLDYWQTGKPVFLLLGGEGTASEVFLKTGVMFELGIETKGAMFIAEHRYYGKSKPFEDFTTENLLYLSSRQALADFAQLLRTIKGSPKFKSSKVVVVGGSYSGNLAAWMKLLYPELVDAAIASSAPVLAKIDFYEYFETVNDVFEQYGSSGCLNNIRQTFSRYEQLFKSTEGIKILKAEENICDDSDMEDKDNQELFFFCKASPFSFLTQHGNPNDVMDFCHNNFTSSFEQNDELDILFHKKNDCYDYDFDDMVKSIRNIDWYTAWIYQTCTEFGYYQTANSANQPFTRNIPVDFYYKQCSKLFDIDAARVEKGVEDVNKLYGGLRPNVTHVVFVNGDMDPWAKLSVVEDISHEAPAKMISKSSHCQDLVSDRVGDSEELIEARKYIKYLIKNWIGEGENKVPMQQ